MCKGQLLYAVIRSNEKHKIRMQREGSTRKPASNREIKNKFWHKLCSSGYVHSTAEGMSNLIRTYDIIILMSLEFIWFPERNVLITFHLCFLQFYKAAKECHQLRDGPRFARLWLFQQQPVHCGVQTPQQQQLRHKEHHPGQLQQREPPHHHHSSSQDAEQRGPQWVWAPDAR